MTVKALVLRRPAGSSGLESDQCPLRLQTLGMLPGLQQALPGESASSRPAVRNLGAKRRTGARAPGLRLRLSSRWQAEQPA